MRITIDTGRQTLSGVDPQGNERDLPLYSPEAFQLVSLLWVKTGWANKHSYGFTWLGRPVIQLAEDLLRLQAVVWETKPSVIVETGVAHGGTSVFFAGLLELLGAGRVVSIDIEIRPHNREAIEAHPLAHRIALIEGDSAAPQVVERARALIGPHDRVMVVLDSNHTKAHVARELERYAPLVTPGCYLVAADGVMADLHDVPGGQPEWQTDNPAEAAREFLETHPEFELDRRLSEPCVTYFPGGYLRRLESPAGSTA